ncbi:34618_t:CDS:2 [Gigaspora margarita]|uniref:34618_t:CDS:1 n=1 Tax=Gigaspora margarita TaxID=4874 RepID=A0ABN7WG18_GIGMA|nr:34618_t:CDS:2 [Gigaspora margarita]
MPPTITTAEHTYQWEFSDDFYANNYTKYSTLKIHQQSAKHIHQKETQLNQFASSSSSTISYQITLPVLFPPVSENAQINIDLVIAFAKADIPLHKVDKIKPFLI